MNNLVVHTRRVVQANKALGFTEISVNLAGIKADPEEVARFITEELARRSSTRSI